MPNPISRKALVPEAQIREAERDSSARIEQLERQTREAQTGMENDLQTQRDHFERTRSEESLNQEQTIEAQKIKGYEALRKLKQNQQEELNNLRREGEETLGRLQNYYRSSIENSVSKGESELDETRMRTHRSQEHEQKSTSGQIEFEKNENAIRLKEIQEEQDKNLNQLQKAGLNHYEKTKETTLGAMRQTEEHFQQNYKQTADAQQNALVNLQSQSADALNRLRYDTSTKLAAYSSRQRDPFYKLIRLDADLDETREAYVLSIRVPEHEEPGLAVTVRGNEIVVSGSRRNEEKLKNDDGHFVTTSSYQSFSESFPISFPVEGKLLTREYDGEDLIVRIPKKSRDLEYKPKPKSAPPERAIASIKPDFPKNLPLREGRENTPPPPAPAYRKPKGTLL